MHSVGLALSVAIRYQLVTEFSLDRRASSDSARFLRVTLMPLASGLVQ